MFEGLAAAIEAVDVPVDGAAIAEVRRLLDRLEATVVEAESAYAATGRHQVEGFGDLATFERHACGASLPESRRRARRATRLGAWPELAEAWRAGLVTGSQVELACALVPRHHVERFARTMADTVAVLAPLTAHQTGAVLRRAVQAADAFAEREAAEAGIEPVERAPERELTAVRALDDELFLRGTLDQDSGAVVERALVAATRDDVDGERRTPKERRADALVAVCQAYLDALADPGANRRTERLTLTADVVDLHRAWLAGAGVRTAAELERFLEERPHLGELDRGLFLQAFSGAGAPATTIDGHAVTDGLLTAVAAGGTLERLLTAGRRVLDHGRAVRTFTAAQRRAVLVRDGGCRSCGAPPERCDVHHVTPWDAGGTTDLANGVAKCRRCHLEHHRRRWRDRLDPDGTYTVTTASGQLATAPHGLPRHLPALAVATSSSPAPELPLRPPVDAWSHPSVVAAADELIRSRARWGDDHPRTVACRAAVEELLDRFDRAA